MIKVYNFLILKTVEKKIKPKDSESIEKSVYKVLYLQVEDNAIDKNNIDDLRNYISIANDFQIGYISKGDYEKVNELQIVKGIFDENGKIKILGEYE